MTMNNDRFEEQYLKGELTLNKGIVVFFALFVCVTLILGFYAAKTRSTKHEATLKIELAALSQEHKSEIESFVQQMKSASLEMEDDNDCSYTYCKKTYTSLNSDTANAFDMMMRENFSYGEVGFTARIIFPHEKGGYFFFGPGIKKFNELEDMWYFTSCVNELLNKGTCSLEPEDSKTESIYTFVPIQDETTGKITAVLLGRQSF